MPPGLDEEAGFHPGNTLWVDLEDVPSANLLAHLPTTNKFICEAVSSGGTVLVVCAQGVSRSPAVRSYGKRGSHFSPCLAACLPVCVPAGRLEGGV